MPVLHCPAYLNKSGGNYYTNSSYAINLLLTNGRPDLAPTHYINAKKRTLYSLKAAPSDVLLIFEYCGPAPIDTWTPINTNDQYLPDNARKRGHLNKSNFLFVDSHVEFFGRYGPRPRVMLGDNEYYGSTYGW
jgi:prepilin-type processing-associated H-X9-DG protein